MDAAKQWEQIAALDQRISELISEALEQDRKISRADDRQESMKRWQKIERLSRRSLKLTQTLSDMMKDWRVKDDTVEDQDPGTVASPG